MIYTYSSQLLQIYIYNPGKHLTLAMQGMVVITWWVYCKMVWKRYIHINDQFMSSSGQQYIQKTLYTTYHIYNMSYNDIYIYYVIHFQFKHHKIDIWNIWRHPTYCRPRLPRHPQRRSSAAQLMLNHGMETRNQNIPVCRS
jgi:hypothetical protein